MHEKVGESRNADGLNEAIQRIRAMREEHSQLGAGSDARDYNFGLVQYLELGALLDVAEAIAVSASERTESRGVHQRTDHPKQDDAQSTRLLIAKGEWSAGEQGTRAPPRKGAASGDSQRGDAQMEITFKFQRGGRGHSPSTSTTR